MIPSTNPITASAPPPTAPWLEAILWRAMNPMIAAVGPRITPRHATVQTIERIPTTSDAMASPSVRGAAYPAVPPA